MKNYIEKCLDGKSYPATETTSPGNEYLFRVADEENTIYLNEADKAIFHTDVERLLYLAKRTRMDILTLISFLCLRVNKLDLHDVAKLKRLFLYLSQTKDLVMRYRINVLVDLIAYIDARFGIHYDGTIRKGMVMMIAGAVVAAWSARQHRVTNNQENQSVIALTNGRNVRNRNRHLNVRYTSSSGTELN